jgi:hypothetical protein
MKRAGIYIFWIIIILGLIVRLLTLSYNGTFDIATYHEWGLNTFKNGLAESYQGIYFPFQYQLFAFSSWLSVQLNIDYFIIFKSVNLIFDCGNLAILYLILRKLGISKFYLLIYWIHPWFLNMFSLGYCDFQFTFFILCTIFFTLKATSGSRDFLFAGIFLGFAFLMKPQVEIIILSFFIYSLFLFFRNRDIRVLHIFIFPAILFINYTLYFLITAGNPLRLANTYLNVADSSVVCLNANFLNFWFPVAYLMKNDGDPIYSISDLTGFAGIPLRYLAVVLVLVLIILYIKKLADKKYAGDTDLKLLLIASFSSFVVPFVMTSAHENHLFLGTVLIIPLLAMSKSIIFKISVHIILLLQAINLYGYYGIGEFNAFKLPGINYNYETALIFSLIASAAFLVMLYYFYFKMLIDEN